jgi:hypothetical protein
MKAVRKSGRWPTSANCRGAVIEGLRAILKGAIVIGTDPASLRIERALPHGHLAATLGWFARSRWTG